MFQAVYDATQFGQSFEPAYQRVPRTVRSVEICQQKMTMIGPNGYFISAPVFSVSTLLFHQKGVNDADHIGTAAEMFGLIKRAILFAFDLAKMGEMNAWGELFHHRKQIVVCPG